MSVILRLKNMIFYSYHGVHQAEQDLGQRFAIDVEYAVSEDLAIADDPGVTVDYSGVYQDVREIVVNRRYNLIESLATVIAEALLDKYPISQVRVRVRKPSVPLGGAIDYAEAEVFKEAVR